MELKANAFEKVGSSLKSSQSIVRPSISFWQDAWRRFKMNKVALVCLIYLALIMLLCIIIPELSHYKISDQELTNTNLGFFQNGHWFGTDQLGRDLFVRVWFGVRISLFIAITAALIDFVIGAVYGGISGYFGGKVDNVMMRTVEVINGIPYLIIVILLMVILKPGVATIILAYVTVGWTGMARLIRGQVLQLKEQEYVLAAKVLGAGSFRIIARHLLPNVLGVIIVNMTLTVPSAIFTEAFLSYIGLGVQIPLASLGTLASDGVANFRTYPSQLFVPAILISLTMLSFNLLGDSLRDVLDPKLRK